MMAADSIDCSYAQLAHEEQDLVAEILRLHREGANPRTIAASIAILRDVRARMAGQPPPPDDAGGGDRSPAPDAD